MARQWVHSQQRSAHPNRPRLHQPQRTLAPPLTHVVRVQAFVSEVQVLLYDNVAGLILDALDQLFAGGHVDDNTRRNFGHLL